MFETLSACNGSRRIRLRKTLTLSVSLSVHAAIVAAVIVVPLLRAESRLPEFKSTDVLIAPPIVPGVPPAGRPGRRVKGPDAARKGTRSNDPASGPATLRAPVEVPTTIEEEDPTAGIPGEAPGPGVEGGPGDGTTPWIIADEPPPDGVNPLAKAITIVQPPRLIKKVSPVYSPVALSAHVEGTVIIEAVTDIYGRVREARVVSGHALLSASVLEAVGKWIYEPYLVNGIPKPVRFTVTVTFALENR